MSVNTAKTITNKIINFSNLAKIKHPMCIPNICSYINSFINSVFSNKV